MCFFDGGKVKFTYELGKCTMLLKENCAPRVARCAWLIGEK